MPKRHRPGKSDASLFAYLDEIVTATSGEDAFEIVFALASRRILHHALRRRASSRGSRASRSTSEGRSASEGWKGELARLAKAWPSLGIRVPKHAGVALLGQLDAALARALPLGAGPEALGALDALFEGLVPRVAKGEKGQFFTPRHVVDFVVQALGPRRRELVVDPSCGSGAFLSHARARAAVETFGTDIDARAVRVARLAALAQGRDPEAIVRADGLSAARASRPPRLADVVATNPPFAGRVDVSGGGFELSDVLRAPERDALFLERSLALLRPKGRLGIVLPYNKAAGASFGGLRRWLSRRARVFAVVSLPRETFLPHTSLRTVVLFAKKRAPRERPADTERTMFASSARAGKDASGEPCFAPDGDGTRVDHDLGDVLESLAPFLASEGFFA